MPKPSGFIWMVNLMYTEYLNDEIPYPNFNFSHLNGECVYPNLILTFGCISLCTLRTQAARLGAPRRPEEW